MWKAQYYEVVAGASAGCHPEHYISILEDIRVAEMTAEKASTVAKRRSEAGKDKHDLDRFVTDAYATVAVAYRRAAGIYTGDRQMQELGTAAVHLLTMATSHMMARSKDGRLARITRNGKCAEQNPR
jgi:hypothetical protein